MFFSVQGVMMLLFSVVSVSELWILKNYSSGIKMIYVYFIMLFSDVSGVEIVFIIIWWKLEL